VVLLGGHDKGLSYDILSRALEGVKYAVICGANSDKIYRAIRGFARAHITNDFECAVREACAMCASSDILLLSPASASFDMFENYRQRASEFARIVRGYKWKK
jgi:UDP-N-acetylmuramoylalanine--D-glutamate ligase